MSAINCPCVNVPILAVRHAAPPSVSTSSLTGRALCGFDWFDASSDDLLFLFLFTREVDAWADKLQQFKSNVLEWFYLKKTNWDTSVFILVFMYCRLYLCILCLFMCDRQQGVPDTVGERVQSEVWAGWCAGTEGPENTWPAWQLHTATPRQHLWVFSLCFHYTMWTEFNQVHVYYLPEWITGLEAAQEDVLYKKQVVR